MKNISRRDLAAMAAMTGYLANPECGAIVEDTARVATWSVELADALIPELDNTEADDDEED